MSNPYADKPPQHFWKPAVAEPAAGEVRPIPARRFRLSPSDRVATAGSCFAQHVSAHLKAQRQVAFLEAESVAPGQPPFSALYGNIYTARQLVQLAEEALEERHPADIAWQRPDGRYIDALRPTVFAEGFADVAAVAAARARHIAAVRALLSGCTLFVFTLGLTEAWRSARDGTVYPLAPGVVAEPAEPGAFEFHNFTYEEVVGDLERFIVLLDAVNPALRVLLTVSPVPLTATFTGEHVLVATTHSKSVLRAACSTLASRHDNLFYFPAYEIITGNFSRGRYFDENLRTIAPEGVAHVMQVFDEAYGPACSGEPRTASSDSTPSRIFSERDADVICDEPEIVKSLGF